MLPTPVRRSGQILTAIYVVMATNTVGLAQSPPKAVDDLLGRWELRGAWTSEGVTTIIELMAGGWYSQTLVATSRLRYEYNGADLFLLALSRTGEPDSSTRRLLNVRFDADTLTAVTARDTIRMVRARGGEFPGDIRGRWLLLSRDPLKPVAEEFSEDGYLKVITTLTGEVGRYRIDDDEIEWEPKLPFRPPHRTKFKLANDRLTLSMGAMRDELVRIR